LSGGAEEHNAGAGQQQQRRQPQQQRLQLERRPQEHELAVAGLDEGQHLAVAVAGGEALAHDDAQVVGQGRAGVVDRLILADDAAQFLGELAGARFERGVVQHLAGLHGVGGGGRPPRQTVMT
jgi:hypothetical protein